MDIASILIQMGLGGGILFVLRESMVRNDSRIDSRDQAFVKFVEEHNDKMTSVVVEATEAIKESTKAIQASTTLIIKISDRFEKD